MKTVVPRPLLSILFVAVACSTPKQSNIMFGPGEYIEKPRERMCQDYVKPREKYDLSLPKRKVISKLHLYLAPIEPPTPKLSNCDLEILGRQDGVRIETISQEYDSRGNKVKQETLITKKYYTSLYTNEYVYNSRGDVELIEKRSESDVSHTVQFYYDNTGTIEKIVEVDRLSRQTDIYLFNPQGILKKKEEIKNNKKTFIYFYFFDFPNNRIEISGVDPDGCKAILRILFFNENGDIISDGRIEYKKYGGIKEWFDIDYEYGYENDVLIYKTKVTSDGLEEVTTYYRDSNKRAKIIRFHSKTTIEYNIDYDCPSSAEQTLAQDTSPVGSTAE